MIWDGIKKIPTPITINDAVDSILIINPYIRVIIDIVIAATGKPEIPVHATIRQKCDADCRIWVSEMMNESKRIGIRLRWNYLAKGAHEIIDAIGVNISNIDRREAIKANP